MNSVGDVSSEWKCTVSSFFRSRYIETKEEDWAVQSRNGTMFGMIGMISRRGADAAVGGLTMYPSRLKFVDFLTPLMIDKYVQT